MKVEVLNRNGELVKPISVFQKKLPMAERLLDRLETATRRTVGNVRNMFSNPHERALRAMDNVHVTDELRAQESAQFMVARRSEV